MGGALTPRGDRQKYLALGITDYVSKPVDQRELVAKMCAVLRLEMRDNAPVALERDRFNRLAAASSSFARP
jgi:DNA-binding response OmpR family regulator